MDKLPTGFVFLFEAARRTTRGLADTITAVCKWTARKSISVARWPVPHYTRWGMYPQVIFIVIALIWFEYRPDWASQGPGVAMAFLAVAAVYMAVRGPDSKRIEGVVWVVVSFCLFAAEMRSIAAERKAHETEQAALQKTEREAREEQGRAFGTLIGKGQDLLRALSEEKNLTVRNLTLTAKNLEHITGGDEYCWVAPMTPLLSTADGEPVIDYKSGNWQIAVMNSGKVVLPTCDVSLMEVLTAEQLKAGIYPWFGYNMHFERLPVLGGGGGRYFQMTSYFLPGARTYSGVIRTPTRELIEVITFDPDPKNPAKYTPHCKVMAPGGTKELQSDCFVK